jgi:hypothetical protein
MSAPAIVVDGLGLTGAVRPIGGATLLGAGLLLAGAVLVVR